MVMFIYPIDLSTIFLVFFLLSSQPIYFQAFSAGQCVELTQEIIEQKFFGISSSQNREISWLFLKFIQVYDGEKICYQICYPKFIVLVPLTVSWTRPFQVNIRHSSCQNEI